MKLRWIAGAALLALVSLPACTQETQNRFGRAVQELSAP